MLMLVSEALSVELSDLGEDLGLVRSDEETAEEEPAIAATNENRTELKESTTKPVGRGGFWSRFFGRRN